MYKLIQQLIENILCGKDLENIDNDNSNDNNQADRCIFFHGIIFSIITIYTIRHE